MTFKVIKDNKGDWLKITSTEILEFKQLNSWLYRYKEGWQFDPRVRMGIWNGKTAHLIEGRLRLGLWGEAKRCCDNYGFVFKVENQEDLPIRSDIKKSDYLEFINEFFSNRKLKDSDKDFILRDYQIEAAWRIIRGGWTMIEVATSGGKTLISSIVILYVLSKINPDSKIIIVVPNVQLITQFHKELKLFNTGYNLENTNSLDLRISEFGGKKPFKCDNPNIYIGTYHSLVKEEPKTLKSFDCIFIDEAHGAGAKTVKKILKYTNKCWLKCGMSGTLPNEDTLEYLEVSQFLGPKVYTVRADELINVNHITPLKIKALILNHNDKDMVETIRLAKRHGDGRRLLDLERNYIQKSKIRNDFISNKIIPQCKNNTLMLFYNIDYGKQLYERIKEQYPDNEILYIDGEIDSIKRDEIKEQMEIIDETRPRILIATYGTLSTGISINAIFNIIFLDSFKSDRIIRQSIGRGLRLHNQKQILNVIDLIDVYGESYKNNHRNIFWKQWKKREEIYLQQNYPYTIKELDMRNFF